MKRINNLNLLILIVIVGIGIIFVSCSKENDTSNEYIKAYYMLTECSTDGKNWSSTNSNGLSMIVTINLTEEGYFTCSVPYASFKGTYKMKGNHFTFTKTENNDPLNNLFSADLSDGILTAETVVNGSEWWFRNK